MITRLAAAKVNLDLRVIGRRADGYHELESLIAFCSIGDVLTFESASDITLRVEGPYASQLRDEPLQNNLVLRAAELLRKYAKSEQGARITLTKNLPVAAGLGGGSADAAATLSGLSELWGIDIGTAQLAGLGLTLGADLPVCLAGIPCYLTGIGEVIKPLKAFPPLWLVLINPRVGLSTPSVFAALDGRISPPRADNPTLGIDDREGLLKKLAASVNDLEIPAIELVPEIADCLSELRLISECLLARMSGSGASCFGLFASPDEAAASARIIRARHPAWWVADGLIDRPKS
ncbi:4-(cytidine 5'-diphospho)-2-C-methyl-D-erythritol kinase [Pelagibius sp. Alg239-R121]|uniref:4-(cytidine 5'-diphospho)-2-C-methyl-D-erythritol kinase n=1 Tax=Pelagibius sp. Alg239-R121 TaxID=2993448 RepID=UPI0024A76C0B|nr:4-(cytidine 5'-diphospho)-2-C-methyl-D-erythritol kinase [Pelagibius sp. Alg239-R121]